MDFRVKGILLLSLAVLAGGCAGPVPAGQKALQPLISAEELLQEIRTPAPPLLVDVRQPDELTGPLGALPNVVNIPLDQLPERFGEIPKDRRVVLVCRTGNRSGKAYRFLQNRGYTQIQDLNGGMTAIREVESR